jgi:hypothetical protein
MSDLQAIIQRHPELERVREYKRDVDWQRERVMSRMNPTDFERGSEQGARWVSTRADAALLELATALEEAEGQKATLIEALRHTAQAAEEAEAMLREAWAHDPVTVFTYEDWLADLKARVRPKPADREGT